MQRSQALSKRNLRFPRGQGLLKVFETLDSCVLDEQLATFLEPPLKFCRGCSNVVVKVVDQHTGKAEALWLRRPSPFEGIQVKSRNVFELGVNEVSVFELCPLRGSIATGTDSDFFYAATIGRPAHNARSRDPVRRDYELRVLEVRLEQEPRRSVGTESVTSATETTAGLRTRLVSSISLSASAGYGAPVSMTLHHGMQGALVSFESGDVLVMIGEFLNSSELNQVMLHVTDTPPSFTAFFGMRRLVFGTESALLCVRTSELFASGTSDTLTDQNQNHSWKCSASSPFHVTEERPCSALVTPVDCSTALDRDTTSNALSPFLVYRRDPSVQLYHLDSCFYLSAVSGHDPVSIESLPDGSVVQQLVVNPRVPEHPTEGVSTRASDAGCGPRPAGGASEESASEPTWTVLSLFDGSVVIVSETLRNQLCVLLRRPLFNVSREALTIGRYSLALRLCYDAEIMKYPESPTLMELRSRAFNGFRHQIAKQCKDDLVFCAYMEDLCGVHQNWITRVLANCSDPGIPKLLIERYESLLDNSVDLIGPEKREAWAEGGVHCPEEFGDLGSPEHTMHSAAETPRKETFCGQLEHMSRTPESCRKTKAKGKANDLDTLGKAHTSHVLDMHENTQADRASAHQEALQPALAGCAPESVSHLPGKRDQVWCSLELTNIPNDIRDPVGSLQNIFDRDLRLVLSDTADATERSRKLIDYITSQRIARILAKCPEALTPLQCAAIRHVVFSGEYAVCILEAVFRLLTFCGNEVLRKDTSLIQVLLEQLQNPQDLERILEFAELYDLSSMTERLYRRLKRWDELAIFLQNRGRCEDLLHLCSEIDIAESHLWEHGLVCALGEFLSSLREVEFPVALGYAQGTREPAETSPKRWAPSYLKPGASLHSVVQWLRRHRIVSTAALPIMCERLCLLEAGPCDDRLTISRRVTQAIRAEIHAEERRFIQELYESIFSTPRQIPLSL